jgi:hypothetical protein
VTIVSSVGDAREVVGSLLERLVFAKQTVIEVLAEGEPDPVLGAAPSLP